MSEYMIDGTLLSNIAEEIRTVDGSTSKLTPAQMKTRLTAIKSSVDAALSALVDKEVEVPSGSNVHGLADLIAAIETGVALPDWLSKVAFGTYTPASTTAQTITIKHGLEQVPDFAIIRIRDPYYTSSYHSVLGSVVWKINDNYARKWVVGYSGSSQVGGYIQTQNYSISSMLTSTNCNFNTNNYYFNSTSKTAYFHNSVHDWIAGVYA